MFSDINYVSVGRFIGTTKYYYVHVGIQSSRALPPFFQSKNQFIKLSYLIGPSNEFPILFYECTFNLVKNSKNSIPHKLIVLFIYFHLEHRFSTIRNASVFHCSPFYLYWAINDFVCRYILLT